jgi:hypothetical protein
MLGSAGSAYKIALPYQEFCDQYLKAHN